MSLMITVIGGPLPGPPPAGLPEGHSCFSYGTALSADSGLRLAAPSLAPCNLGIGDAPQQREGRGDGGKRSGEPAEHDG